MASEQEQLIEQLKEITDSLKSVSQYSKDLSAAVASANRPMQQMSEYAKNMKESISDMMEKVASMNSEESESVKLLNEKQAALAAQRTETEALRAAHVAIKVEQDRYWTEETKAGKARNEALQDTANLWEKIKKGIAEAHSVDAEGRVKEYTFGTKSNTVAMGLTGASNVAGGLSSLASSMSQLFPVAGGLGGLLGMIMYGKVKEAEFNALGQVAAQQFDQIGGYSDAFANKLTGLTRRLSVAGMAAKEDIAKITGAMVEFGMTAEDAQTKIEGFTSAAGNDFLALSLSMDKSFEMAAGTTAKFAGTLVRDFNMSTKDAANNLMLMAQAAKDSGANVAVFMQQTMEAASALRLMNANQEAVFETQARVSKAYQRTGLNQQFAGAYAAQGTQQLTGAVGGGMNEGVRAVLAQRMYGGDALDALYKLQSPIARGNEKLDVNQFVREMGNLMREAGVQGQGAQYKFSESVFGIGTAGADAFMKAIQEQERTGKVSQQTQDEISKGLTKEADKISELTRIAEQIKNAVAETMVGLLGMIVSGIKLLYNGLMYAVNVVQSALSVTDAKQQYLYAQKADIYSDRMGTNMLDIGKGANVVAGGASDVMKGMLRGAGQFGLNIEDDMSDKRLQYINRQLRGSQAAADDIEKYGEGSDDLSQSTPATMTKTLYRGDPSPEVSALRGNPARRAAKALNEMADQVDIKAGARKTYSGHKQSK